MVQMFTSKKREEKFAKQKKNSQKIFIFIKELFVKPIPNQL